MERVYTKVSSKGQMVIPAAIREQLGIEAGTRVAVSLEGGRVMLDPETLAARISKIKGLRGYTAGGPSMTEALLEDRRMERERELVEEGW